MWYRVLVWVRVWVSVRVSAIASGTKRIIQIVLFSLMIEKTEEHNDALFILFVARSTESL